MCLCAYTDVLYIHTRRLVVFYKKHTATMLEKWLDNEIEGCAHELVCKYGLVCVCVYVITYKKIVTGICE